MTAPLPGSEARLPLLERMARGTGRFIGDALTAIGFVTVIVNYASWNRDRGGSDGAPFFIALAALVLAWLALRRRSTAHARPAVRELAIVAREALMLTMPLLATSCLMFDFMDTRQRFVQAMLKTHLRDLERAEEKAKADSGRYVATIDGIGSSLGRPVIHLTPDGWFATEENLEAGLRCTIYKGSRPSQLEGDEGYPTCTYTGTAPYRWKGTAIGLAMLIGGLVIGTAAGTLGRREAVSYETSFVKTREKGE